jgi:hypothetical protein
MELLDQILHVEEVIVDASHLNESALVLRDQVPKHGGKAVFQQL